MLLFKHLVTRRHERRMSELVQHPEADCSMLMVTPLEVVIDRELWRTLFTASLWARRQIRPSSLRTFKIYVLEDSSACHLRRPCT